MDGAGRGKRKITAKASLHYIKSPLVILTPQLGPFGIIALTKGGMAAGLRAAVPRLWDVSSKPAVFVGVSDGSLIMKEQESLTESARDSK